MKGAERGRGTTSPWRGWAEFDCIEPDLICYSKAIGNGYPIAAAVGTDALRSAAEAVFTSGTYWYSAVPMAASLAVLGVLEETDALDRLSRLGTRWAEGLERLGTESGFRVFVTGPPGLSYLTFDNDPNLYLMQVFAAEMIAKGVFIHPYHSRARSMSPGSRAGNRSASDTTLNSRPIHPWRGYQDGRSPSTGVNVPFEHEVLPVPSRNRAFTEL